MRGRQKIACETRGQEAHGERVGETWGGASGSSVTTGVSYRALPGGRQIPRARGRRRGSHRRGRGLAAIEWGWGDRREGVRMFRSSTPLRRAP